MALESANYITELVSSNPTGGDDRSTADDQIRMVKHVLKTTFPYISGPINVTQAQINALTGIVGDIQSDISANDSNITNLSGRVDTLETSVSALDSQVTTLNSVVAGHIVTLATQSGQIGLLESSVSGLDSRIDDLSATMNALLPQGTVYGGRISSDGTVVAGPTGWSCNHPFSGIYEGVHNMGLSTASCVAVVSGYNPTGYTSVVTTVTTYETNYFEVITRKPATGSADDYSFMFTFMKI